MTGLTDQITAAITGHYPIIYLRTTEEARCVAAIHQLAKTQGADRRVVTWSCLSGLDGGDPSDDSRDPALALQRILATAQPGFYIMKDLSAFMDQPAVNRALRDAYQKFSATDGPSIFIVSPSSAIPESLSGEIYFIDVDLPHTDELLARLREVQRAYPKHKLSEDALRDIALSLNGLSLKDAGHVMHQICGCEKLTAGIVRGYINAHKRRAAASGTATCMEYVPIDITMDQVGGLRHLKEWIAARRTLFSQKSRSIDMPIPRGILIMGISGCGKSLCAKVIAGSWEVPLFRLDMNLVFSQLHGNPEAAFHKTLRAVEAAAPAVLWIDEIENGMGLLDGGNSSGNQSHIYSAFLTWMQEKPPLVFVAATANRIESLPAELIRKGRFDQVFFCDLPTDEERAEIIQIHIKANRQDPADFNIRYLANITKEWNAAEIEQAIQGGRINASNQGRAFTTQDIASFVDTIVPLSATMSEQIKRIRDWAWDRATPASKGKGMELSLSEEG